MLGTVLDIGYDTEQKLKVMCGEKIKTEKEEKNCGGVYQKRRSETVLLRR